MALRLPDILSKCVATRWRLFLSLLALFFLLILLLILAAPTILSSNLAQNRLKSTLSTALQGPVDWSSMQLSWKRGLQLRNLTVGPATGALRQAHLAAIDCRPGFGFAAKPGASFGLDLFLRLDDLQLELTPPAATPTPPPAAPSEEKADPLTALAQGLDRFATLSWPLPIDLRVDVVVAPVTLSYHDPVSGHRLHFVEGDLQFKMPSLEQLPLMLSLNGKVAVDEHPLGALRLATEIAGLVAPTGRLIPSGALLSTVVDFPGLVLKADGRLDQEQGVQGELNLDLPQLQRVASPFLPENLPALSGTLLATLNARIDNEQDLALSCTLAGRKLAADKIGPFDFDLGQQVKTDHQRQLVTLGGGVLMVPHFLEANWEARIEEPSSPERRQVSARLHQLTIDLDQALAQAVPFLPPGLPQVTGGQLQLRNLDLELHGAGGDGELRLANATVTLENVRLGALNVANSDLATSDLKIPLRGYFPASVGAGIEWKIASIDQGGAQPLALSTLAGSGHLAIAAIRQAAGEGGLSTNGRFDHQLALKSAEVTGLVRLSALANDLHLAFALRPDGGISVETLQLNTDITALATTVAGKELQPLPLKQTLQVEGVALRPGANLPAIKNVAFSVTSHQLVNVKATGSLTAERLFSLQGQSRLELPRLIALIGPLLPEKLAASGTISNDLTLVATLPPDSLPPLQGEGRGGDGVKEKQAPLRSARTALALLQELKGSLQLDGVELRLPLANGNLHLSGIKTSPPFSLHSSNRGERIDLAGALAFDLRADSRLNGKALPAEHGEMAFTGELRDWDRAFLAENLSIMPLGLAERFELTIAGLASLLDLPLPPPTATLLQRLDATLFSEIDLDLRPDAPQLLPELAVTGRTLAGSRIDLRGNDFLRLHAYADIDNLNVTMAKGVQLQGLQAHVNLDRTLQIRSAATVRVPWRPLSTSLVQPLPPPLAPLLEGERRRLHDDLRGNSGQERSLTIQSLTLPGLAGPLTISALEAEIVSGQEELGMNFLQTELLGGTLRTRALLDLRPTVPALSAEALFTNLDLSRLGSALTEDQAGGAESSISGEGSLHLPLLDERRALLEGFSLSARLRSIGAKSFDRALASLDPYERNEAIMAQRKLLRLGQLQGVEVEARDGALSLSGAVSSRGISLALPRIDRLRLAELPLQKELAPLLSAISAARPPLEFVRADTIAIGAQGEISLRKEEK